MATRPTPKKRPQHRGGRRAGQIWGLHGLAGHVEALLKTIENARKESKEPKFSQDDLYLLRLAEEYEQRTFHVRAADDLMKKLIHLSWATVRGNRKPSDAIEGARDYRQRLTGLEKPEGRWATISEIDEALVARKNTSDELRVLRVYAVLARDSIAPPGTVRDGLRGPLGDAIRDLKR